MAGKHVFVSFDYENDRHYKFLLQAWHKHPEFDFEFTDRSSQEIQSHDIGIVKQALSTQINRATHTLVIIGREANKVHADAWKIGHRNWINFEINRSIHHNNKIVAVKLSPYFDEPEEMRGVAASWAHSFEEAQIVAALRNAR